MSETPFVPQPMQLAKIATLGPLQVAMPAIEEYVEKKLKAVDNATRSAKTAGRLTPDLALQAWYERFSLQDLLKGLDHKQNAAKTAGETLQTFLDHA